MPYSNRSSQELESLAPNSLFFPICSAACPFKFHERLVFAWLVMAENEDIDKCAKYLHTDKRTIVKAYDKVKEREQSLSFDQKWFVKRKCESEYPNNLAYFVVTFREDETAIQSCAKSLFRSLKGTGRNVTYAGMAKLLGLDRNAVSRAMTGKKRIQKTSVNNADDHAKGSVDAKDSSVQKAASDCAKGSIEDAKGSTDRAKGSTLSICNYPLTINSNYPGKEEESSPAEEETQAPPAAEEKVSVRDLLDRKVNNAIHSMQYFKFSQAEQKEIIGLLLRKASKNPDMVYCSDYSGYIIELVQEHRKRGRPGTGAKLVGYKLRVALGDIKPTVTPPKPKPKLTEDQIEAVQSRREFERMMKEDAAIPSWEDVKSDTERKEKEREERRVRLGLAV